MLLCILKYYGYIIGNFNFGNIPTNICSNFPRNISSIILLKIIITINLSIEKVKKNIDNKHNNSKWMKFNTLKMYSCKTKTKNHKKTVGNILWYSMETNRKCSPQPMGNIYMRIFPLWILKQKLWHLKIARHFKTLL